jgi:predicted Zn-ribbon and HTH transcriptional regulator
MAFPEKLKQSVRRRAYFTCCLCQALGVEVHHIVPEAEGGADTEDNAAPLCPSCHETYGANPQKRKFIREARDFWYELCERRFASDPDRLEELGNMLKNVATKQDLEVAVGKVLELFEDIENRMDRSTAEKAQEVSQISGMMLSARVGVSRHCKNCGSSFGLLIGDQGKCPQCGHPW